MVYDNNYKLWTPIVTNFGFAMVYDNNYKLWTSIVTQRYNYYFLLYSYIYTYSYYSYIQDVITFLT